MLPVKLPPPADHRPYVRMSEPGHEIRTLYAMIDADRWEAPE